MAKETYRNILSYKPLKLNTAVLHKYMDMYPIELKHSIVDKSSLVGIEVEVENLGSAPAFDGWWHRTEDGSLRNFGREYISEPLRGSQVEYGLRLLFNTLQSYPYKFTPRCSVHIHINARYMTCEQLSNMMLIYLVFEKALFKYVGQDRDKNIHCVPLLDTELLSRLFQVVNLERPPGQWMKYTAVNLVTLGSLGTIEFRHMHGTDDVDRLMDWINIILSMKIYAYKTNPEELRAEIFNLNTNSQYRDFAARVFKKYMPLLIDDNDYAGMAALMEEGATMAKVLLSPRAVNLTVKKGTICAEYYSPSLKYEKDKKLMDSMVLYGGWNSPQFDAFTVNPVQEVFVHTNPGGSMSITSNGATT